LVPVSRYLVISLSRYLVAPGQEMWQTAA